MHGKIPLTAIDNGLVSQSILCAKSLGHLGATRCNSSSLPRAGRSTGSCPSVALWSVTCTAVWPKSQLDSHVEQSFCMYGYDAGVLGGVQTTKPFLDAMHHPTGTYVIPMIASSYTLAAAVCSLAVTILGMPLGRRGCILMGDALVIVGASIQASSWSVAQIIVGRVLCGFGIGFISCTGEFAIPS
jgi:fucose permease